MVSNRQYQEALVHEKSSIRSLATTVVAAFYLYTSLNYVAWLGTGVSPDIPLPLWALGLTLLLAAGLAALSHRRPMLYIEYVCVGILIGFFFFVASLYTSTVHEIGLLQEFMLGQQQILVFFSYVTAMLTIAAAGGYVAGLGFRWGQNLSKKITRK